MLMTDAEIRQALGAEKLRIAGFSDASLEAASYDMRVGPRLLISSDEAEIDLSKKGSTTIKPGVFALVTTHENLQLPNDIAGHIGVKSYYTRKGIVMLTGLQIDPGFEGVLVVGLYNASPRSITLDYLAPFCTVEFHQLSRAVEKPFISGDEQRQGYIPRADKDYLRTLETQSLSDMSESLRKLTVDVSSLASSIKIIMWLIPIIVGVGMTVVAIIAKLK